MKPTWLINKVNKLSTFIILVLTFISSGMSAQNSEANLIADDQTNTENFQQSVAVVENTQLLAEKFIQSFGINERNYNKAKALKDIQMLTGPNKNDAASEIVIKQGESLRLYKLFATEKVWAAKFQESWGFVPMADVMQVMEEKMNTTFSPYDTPPKMKSNISLKYPANARELGIQGDVVFSILVDKDGDVKEYIIMKSIPELDAAAIEAVNELKFKPGKYKNEPVEVWMRFPISFKIKMDEPQPQQ